MNPEISKHELLDQIVAEYTRQTREGQQPDIANYKRQHPQLADEIEDLLTSVAMIEGLKSDSSIDKGESTVTRDFSNLKQIGDYVIIREVGRGGMGVVFEAVHQSLGRRVALKVLLEKNLDNEKNITRFRREARAAAKLHHTNIVSVFGVGEHDGYQYYVMEYIDGISLKSAVNSLTQGDGSMQAFHQDLTQVVQRQPSTLKDDATSEFILSESEIRPPVSVGSKQNLNTTAQPGNSTQRHRWVARLGSQIADALAYSHQQGVLHRDIKPANLLLDHQEQVWITDFGLVKLSDEDGITKTGSVIGTPQYLAPESLKGEYDQRSETYCLGLTLYELATLQPAFEPGSHAEVFHRIIHESPTAPAKADPLIPRDLATVIEKAINKEPNQRYESATALRDDLRAFLQDRPISARRPSVVEQAFRWGRKNPLVASLAALSVLLVCATAIISCYAWAMTNRAYTNLKIEAQNTEQALALAEKNETIATENLNRSEANVKLMVESYDGLFQAFLAKGTPGAERKLDFDGFNELAGIEISIDESDARYLKTMAAFYERFARQNSENESLLEDAAKGWRRVANINFLIGDTENAIGSYEKAVECSKEILQLDPNSIDALLRLVDVRGELCNAIRQGEMTNVERNWKPFQLIQDNLGDIEAHPQAEAQRMKFALAKTLSALASAEVCRLATESVVDFNRAEELNRRQPRRRGSEQYDKKAQKYVQRAVKIARKLSEDNPDRVEYQILLARSYCSLGAFEANFGDHEKANRSLQLAIEKFQSLAKSEPENLDYQYQLAISLLLLPPEKSGETAREQILEVKTIADALAEKSPNPEYRQLKITSRLKLADLYMSNRQRKTAFIEFEDAIDLLVDSQLEGPSLQSMLRETFQTLGSISKSIPMAERRNFVSRIRVKLEDELKRAGKSGFGPGQKRPFRRNW